MRTHGATCKALLPNDARDDHRCPGFVLAEDDKMPLEVTLPRCARVIPEIDGPAKLTRNRLRVVWNTQFCEHVTDGVTDARDDVPA